MVDKYFLIDAKIGENVEEHLGEICHNRDKNSLDNYFTLIISKCVYSFSL